jgi:hypothetical protein
MCNPECEIKSLTIYSDIAVVFVGVYYTRIKTSNDDLIAVVKAIYKIRYNIG